MKARVIKEWEMYGITHKVGEIMTISLHSPGGLPMISDRDAFLLENGFIEEMKEPLIKDEKIRNAVRAWAEACRLTHVTYKLASNEFYDADTRGKFAIKFTLIPVEVYLKDGESYTIDELCGEDEE